MEHRIDVLPDVLPYFRMEVTVVAPSPLQVCGEHGAAAGGQPVKVAQQRHVPHQGAHSRGGEVRNQHQVSASPETQLPGEILSPVPWGAKSSRDSPLLLSPPQTRQLSNFLFNLFVERSCGKRTLLRCLLPQSEQLNSPDKKQEFDLTVASKKLIVSEAILE